MTCQYLKVESIKLVFDIETSVEINVKFNIIKPLHYFNEIV